MQHDYASYFIIFLSSFSVGMIVGLIVRRPIEYHGPNAKKFCSQTYYDSKTDQCIRFGVRIVSCLSSAASSTSRIRSGSRV